MKKSVPTHATIVAAQEQVSSDLGEESVILNLKSGVYYGLDPVGTRVWQLVQTPRTAADIRDARLEEYDVAPQRCVDDLSALLERMEMEGLIQVIDEEDQ